VVKLGSTRTRYDLERAQDALAKQRAQLDVQKAKLGRLRKDPLPEKLRFAGEELAYAESVVKLSERELVRGRELSGQGLMAQAQLDAVVGKHEANVNRERLAQRKSALLSAGLEESIIKEAEAQVKLIEREVTNMEREVGRLTKELEKCTFKATCAGQVVAVYKREGEAVAAGELILAVASSPRTQIKVYVPEQSIYKVGLGQLARIYSSVYTYRKYGTGTAEVAAVRKWAEDKAGKPVYEVVLSVQEAPFPMLLGSSAQAEIVVARRGILDMLLDRG